jgi:hypothetical protein
MFCLLIRYTNRGRPDGSLMFWLGYVRTSLCQEVEVGSPRE